MGSSLRNEGDAASDRDDAAGADCFARLRRGDPEALERLLECYWSPLVSYAGHLTRGNLDAAEDLVQEAFVRVWERRASWREGSLAAPVLYTIVRNLALNEVRTGDARRLVLRDLVLRGAAGRTPGDELERRELGSAIQRAIDALPARRREVFVLARFHDLSYAEIAQVMSLSPQTVANQMSAALTALRSALRPLLADEDGRP